MFLKRKCVSSDAIDFEDPSPFKVTMFDQLFFDENKRKSLIKLLDNFKLAIQESQHYPYFTLIDKT